MRVVLSTFSITRWNPKSEGEAVFLCCMYQKIHNLFDKQRLWAYSGLIPGIRRTVWLIYHIRQPTANGVRLLT